VIAEQGTTSLVGQVLDSDAERPILNLTELQAAAWRKIREIELLQAQIRERQQELQNLNRRIAAAEQPQAGDHS